MKAVKQIYTQQMHLRGKKKKGSGKRTNLLTEQNLVIGDPTFWFKSKVTHALCTLFKFIKDENGHVCVTHAFRGLTALKPMKLNMMMQTWNLLVFLTRFRRKKVFLWRTLANLSVEKIKVSKLKIT